MAGTWYVLTRQHCPRTLTTTGLTGSLSAVLLLTFWGSGSGYVGNCTVNRQISEAFLNDQGLLITSPKLTEAQAQDAARHSPRVPPDVTIGKGTLAMVSVDGRWRAAWLFPTGIGSDAGPVVGIDAVTGEFTPPQAQG